MARHDADAPAPGRGGPPEHAVGRGRALPALLAALFALKLAVVLFAVGRGFELGDEGFLLFNLNRPAESPRFYEFYKLLLLLGEPPRIGVVEARLARIATELFASLALVGGIFAWARARVLGGAGAPARLFLPFCLLGAFLHAGSRTFSYNDATNLCSYAAVGGLFYLASRPRGAPLGPVPAAVALGVGFACGFQLFVKFPAAIALVALVALGHALLLRGSPARERATLAGLGGAGLLAAVALFVAANGGVAPLVAKFRGAAEVGRLAGYAPLPMLFRYAVFETWTAVNLLVAGAVFTVAAWHRARSRSTDGAVAGALWIAAGVLVVTVLPLHPVFTPGSLTYLAAFLGFAVAALATLWHRRFPDGRGAGAPSRAEAFLPLLLLLALPLANFAGTNVPFALRLPSHVLPVFAALALPAHALRRGGLRRSYAALALLLAALTSAVFLRTQVLDPYGLRRPLYEQTSEVEGLPVRIDHASARFLEAVAASFRRAGFRPGDPIVAFDYMPGLVYYLGGRSPGFPFYAVDKPRMNCFNLARAELERAPYLILGQPLSKEQRACIEAFDFPEDFRRIRVLRFPYEEAYASFGAHGLSHVSLYAPRRSAGGSAARRAPSGPVERETHSHRGRAALGVEGDREDRSRHALRRP